MLGFREALGSKDPNTWVPFKGGYRGYIGIYGDYNKGSRTQIIGFLGPNTIIFMVFGP